MSPSAPPFATQPGSARMSRCRRRRAADQLGVRAHRGGDAGAAVERLEPGERVAIRSSGSAKVDDAAAVDRRRHRRRVDLGRARRPRRAAPAEPDGRGAGSPPSASRAPGRAPASPRACRSSCGGAARRLLAPHSRSSSRRRRLARAARAPPSSCSGEARCEAEAIARSRSSRSSRARASGSAWSGFAEERMKVTSPGSPAAPTSVAVANGDRVDAVDRLDDLAARDGYPDRVHRRSLVARAAGDGGVAPSPRRAGLGCADREGGARAHRDAEDLRPAARRLEGRRFAGARRRGKRLLFPTDDGELVLLVHLMTAGRLRYLDPGRRDRRRRRSGSSSRAAPSSC